MPDLIAIRLRGGGAHPRILRHDDIAPRHRSVHGRAKAARSDLAQNHVFVGKNAFSEMFTLEAIKLIGQSLETAYRDGNSRKAAPI